MSDVSDRYRQLSAAFADKIAAVPPDRWTAATPCTEWTVRDLVRHVAETPGMFFGLVGREQRPGPSVDDDPLGAFTRVRNQVQADLDDPARAEAEFDGYFGRSTFAEAVGRFVCFDLTVHGWDLARATGQDERIDPAEVARLWEGVELFGDAIRSEGTCGPAACDGRVDDRPAVRAEPGRLRCVSWRSRGGDRAGGVRLSQRTLSRAMLARQLLERSATSPTAAVEHLVGLQAQTPHSWYAGRWAGRLRPGCRRRVADAVHDPPVTASDARAPARVPAPLATPPTSR